jgi:ribonuclease BN (tRNA processing enzyme)
MMRASSRMTSRMASRMASRIASRVALTTLALCTAASTAHAQRRFTQTHACTDAQRAAGCFIVLGTGTPVPDPDHFGSGYAFVYGDRTFLFDAGVGVMRRAAAAGLAIDGFTRVFISHLHSDHTLGLPDVMLTTWTMGRRTPMTIVGPAGIANMTRHILEAYSEDIRMRTDGLEHGQPNGQQVTTVESSGGVAYDSAGVRIRLIPVKHGNWPVAYGFVIETPTRKIVMSGDAAPSPAIDTWARNADILVHETYPDVRLKPENRPGGQDWPQYMRDAHTSDAEVGALAAKAGVKHVVLSHIVRMGGTDEELIAGVRKGGYTGLLTIARDLQVF